MIICYENETYVEKDDVSGSNGLLIPTRVVSSEVSSSVVRLKYAPTT